jgi:hypothetical protein
MPLLPPFANHNRQNETAGLFPRAGGMKREIPEIRDTDPRQPPRVPTIPALARA